jgi:hypothetical protein
MGRSLIQKNYFQGIALTGADVIRLGEHLSQLLTCRFCFRDLSSAREIEFVG